jgi:hypothetical protein
VTPGRKKLTVTWPAPVDGGSPITSYDVTVAATNALGTGAASAAARGTPSAVVPGAPSSVVATAHDGSASVAFAPPADDGDLPVTGYTAYASTGEQVTGTGSPLAFTGLANGVERTFTVAATNDKGTGAASSGSNPVAFYDSALTISPTLRTVVAGTAAVLSGTLTSGASDSRQLVLRTYVNGALTKTQPVTTSITGDWSASVLPAYTSTYRVVYAGDATHEAVVSAAVTVQVKTRVLVTSPRSGTKTTARTVTVTGKVTPNKAGTYVRLYEVRSDGTLAYLTTARVTSTGGFTLVRTLAKGTHRLTVTIPATSGNLAGRSATVVVYEV